MADLRRHLPRPSKQTQRLHYIPSKSFTFIQRHPSTRGIKDIISQQAATLRSPSMGSALKRSPSTSMDFRHDLPDQPPQRNPRSRSTLTRNPQPPTSAGRRCKPPKHLSFRVSFSSLWSRYGSYARHHRPAFPHRRPFIHSQGQSPSTLGQRPQLGSQSITHFRLQ